MVYWSRLSLAGEFILDSPLRITASGGSGTIVVNAEGQPYIPGSTFRGALRTYIESALRSMSDPELDRQETISIRALDGRTIQTTRIVTICCDSADKRDDDLNYQGCLTKAIVKKWEADPVLKPNLESALVNCTCDVCRLFGTTWLAGRVFIPDLILINTPTNTPPKLQPNGSPPLQTRGGVALSRDRDTAIKERHYERQAVAPGQRFKFQLLAENVSEVEQGMLLLGIRAFVDGWIALGADRTQGLGRGHLSVDWQNCRYYDKTNLINGLLGNVPAAFTEQDAANRLTDLALALGIDWSNGPQDGDSEDDTANNSANRDESDVDNPVDADDSDNNNDNDDNVADPQGEFNTNTDQEADQEFDQGFNNAPDDL